MYDQPSCLVTVRVGAYAYGKCWWAQKPPWAHFCRFALWGSPHHHLQKHWWWLLHKDVVFGVPFLNLLPFLAKKVIQSMAQCRDSLACHPKDSSLCFPRSCLLQVSLQTWNIRRLLRWSLRWLPLHMTTKATSWYHELPHYLTSWAPQKHRPLLLAQNSPSSSSLSR